MPDWAGLAERSIRGEAPTREEALAVLRAPEESFLPILDAAYRVRRHFHGNRVKVHVLENAMSGMCPEDCHWCSQSRIATGDVERYRLETREEMLEGARKAKASGAWKYCIVTSTRGPNSAQLDVVCDTVREIKEKVGIKICTSLGIVDKEQARRLKEAGVDRFNHNLETSARHFDKVCTSHTWEDRVKTIEAVHEAGMESCCGGILGMGESDEDAVDLVFELRRLGVTSIPINFLNPRPGTPLAAQPLQDPKKAIRALCMARFVNPSRDIRCAGGREVVLRSLQPLALYPCNSIFTNGYLTTGGNAESEDLRMIREHGFDLHVDERCG
jgi:biotin synthase